MRFLDHPFMPISVEQRNGETWKMKVAATVFEPLLEELPPLPFLFSATLRAPVFVRGLSSHRSYQRLWSGTYMELPLWSYEVINYIYKWIAPMVLPSKHGYSPPQGDPWDPHRPHRSMCLRTSLASNPLWPKASAVLPQRDTQNPGVLWCFASPSWDHGLRLFCEMHFFSTTARNMESVYCGWVYHNGHQLEGYL